MILIQGWRFRIADRPENLIAAFLTLAPLARCPTIIIEVCAEAVQQEIVPRPPIIERPRAKGVLWYGFKVILRDENKQTLRRMSFVGLIPQNCKNSDVSIPVNTSTACNDHQSLDRGAEGSDQDITTPQYLYFNLHRSTVSVVLPRGHKTGFFGEVVVSSYLCCCSVSLQLSPYTNVGFRNKGKIADR